MADQRDPQTYKIIGAAMVVHRELGPGFLEAVYQDALAVELDERQIPFEREKKLVLQYKGKQLNSFYRADFICFGEILIELKALKALTEVDNAQVLHYLKATGLHRGILLNFGEPRLVYKRFVYNYLEN